MALTRWEPQWFVGQLRHEIDKVFEDFFTVQITVPKSAPSKGKPVKVEVA